MPHPGLRRGHHGKRLGLVPCTCTRAAEAAGSQPSLCKQGSSSGCSGGGSASGGATGDVPTGMISINGMCYNSETDSDQTTFAVIGDITIGQCYNAIEGKSNRSSAPRTSSWPASKSVCNTCYGHMTCMSEPMQQRTVQSNCSIIASYHSAAIASKANSVCQCRWLPARALSRQQCRAALQPASQSLHCQWAN